MATGIILNNSGDGGSLNSNFTKITEYAIEDMMRFPSKRIPGALTPTVDTDTIVVSPRKYTYRLHVTDAERVQLLYLKSEGDKTLLLTDHHATGISTVDVRCTQLKFTADIGNLTLPWHADVVLEATGE